MLEEYGEFGKFIRSEKHHTAEAGPLPTGEAGSIELEMAKAAYLETLKICTRSNRAWTSKHPSAYSKLRASLGDDIISLLKSREGYDDMENSCDPLTLFEAAKEVIMAGTSGSKMLDRERCQSAFHSFQMGSLSLLRYEKEFDSHVAFMKLAEVVPQPSQADLSLKYSIS